IQSCRRLIAQLSRRLCAICRNRHRVGLRSRFTMLYCPSAGISSRHTLPESLPTCGRSESHAKRPAVLPTRRERRSLIPSHSTLNSQHSTSPPMAYIDQFFEVLINAGASDLHLGQGQPPKIRRHGEILPIRDEVLTHDETAYMISEICGQDRWSRFEETGDLDFAYEMDEHSRFRCNYLKQTHGYGAVFRLIPTKILTLDQLGIPPVVKEFGHLRGGLVLVTGPTGSGKSTKLAALLDYIHIHFSP